MTDLPMTKAPDLLEMPSSLNDACRKLEWADGEIISLRAQLAAAEAKICTIRQDLHNAQECIARETSRTIRAGSQLQAMRKALETIRTSWAGYVITDPKQYPDVLSAMWKEVERMDKIARSALTEGAGK